MREKYTAIYWFPPIDTEKTIYIYIIRSYALWIKYVNIEEDFY